MNVEKQVENKMKKTKQTSKNPFKKILVIGIIAAIVIAAGYLAVISSIPVNGTVPVFEAPENKYIKALYDEKSGYVYAVQSVKGGKSNPNANSVSPPIVAVKDQLVSIHFINEDKTPDSKHNINIDEFNVHSNSLGYFQSQSITFIADKPGEYDYYCTIHPEMHGKLTVN